MSEMEFFLSEGRKAIKCADGAYRLSCEIACTKEEKKNTDGVKSIREHWGALAEALGYYIAAAQKWGTAEDKEICKPGGIAEQTAEMFDIVELSSSTHHLMQRWIRFLRKNGRDISFSYDALSLKNVLEMFSADEAKEVEKTRFYSIFHGIDQWIYKKLQLIYDGRLPRDFEQKIVQFHEEIQKNWKCPERWSIQENPIEKELENKVEEVRALKEEKQNFFGLADRIGAKINAEAEKTRQAVNDDGVKTRNLLHGEKPLTQEQLANILGVSRKTIYLWNRGEGNAPEGYRDDMTQNEAAFCASKYRAFKGKRKDIGNVSYEAIANEIPDPAPSPDFLADGERDED